jgi:peptidoglycan/LPS O-acetylase OafA/YrhL
MSNAERFRPDIEGLRAVAVLLVVLYHAHIPGTSGGYVGVDVFFVLSGYLITRLLSDEFGASGRIDLLRFYARRVRRLLPASALMIGVVALGCALTLAPVEQDRIAATFIATAAYSSNLFFAWKSADYLGGVAEHDPLLHTWSLTVEEQFYLVWPAVVWLALKASAGARPKARVRPFEVLLLLTTVLGFAASVAITRSNQPYAFFLTPLRAWEFSIGALACSVQPWLPKLRPYATLLAGAGMVATLASGMLFDERTAFPGPFAAIPALGTIALLLAGESAPTNLVSRALSTRPMLELGRLSYSWYLWHWPALVLLASPVDETRIEVRLALLLGSLLVAKASFELVEKPLRFSAWLAPSWRSLGVGAVVSLLLVGTGFGWRTAAEKWQHTPTQEPLTRAMVDRPEVYASDCHVEYEGTSSPLDRCTFGSSPTAPLVVLYGDSHAAHWFPALELAAREGRIQLLSLTKSGCRPEPSGGWLAKRRRAYHECRDWVASSLARLAELRPAAVLMAGRDTRDVAEERWTDGVRSVLQATEAAGSRVVLMLDVPQPRGEVSVCASRAVWRDDPEGASECAFPFERVGHVDAAARAVKHDRLRIFDPRPWVCAGSGARECEPLVQGVPVWRDESHISVDFARRFSAELVDVALSTDPPGPR